MTQEEKARAYDEALDRCKQWASGTWGHSVDDSPKDIAEFIFPQLAESGGENLKNLSGYYKAGKFWKASTLWEATKDKIPQRVPNRYILQKCTWNIGTLQEFADEIKNIQEVSLDYPIILDMNGNILDGAHRVVKAYLEGKDIDIVYLGDDEWPEPDYDEEKAVKESEDKRIRKMLIEKMKIWHEQALENNAVEDIKDSSDIIAYLEKQKEQNEESSKFELKTPDWVHGGWDDEYMINTVVGRYSLHAEVAKKRGDTHDYNLSKSMENWLRNVVKPLILEKQKENNEYVFRPLAGTDINTAVLQAIRRANEGDRLVLAFNGAYIPVRKGCDANKIMDIYDAFIKKQEPAEIDEYKIIKKHITEDSLSSEVNKRLKECGWYVTDAESAELPTMNGNADLYFDEWNQQQRNPTKRQCFEEGIKYAQRLQKEQKSMEYLDKGEVYAIMKKLLKLAFSQLIPINSEEYKMIDEITCDVRKLLDYPIEQKPADNVSKEEYVKRFKALCDVYEIKLPNREYDIYHLCDDLSKLSIDSSKQKPVEWGEEIIRKAVKEVGLTQHQIDWFKTNVFLPKQEWSEEDEKIRQSIIKDIEFERNYTFATTNKTVEKYTEQINWLKNLSLDLKKRNEDIAKLCSNEWSEEDEKMLDKVCCLISPGTKLTNDNADYCVELKQWIISLQERILKSLRPQPKQEIYQSVKHDLAIKFMNYLDENRPEGKMCLSNGECEDIDKAFKENDWNKIIRYIEKYGRRN